jgi:hypothetical protein
MLLEPARVGCDHTFLVTAHDITIEGDPPLPQVPLGGRTEVPAWRVSSGLSSRPNGGRLPQIGLSPADVLYSFDLNDVT